MKAVIIILIIITTLGCKDIDKLNNDIYEVQKQAILNSPYKSASGTTVYADAQKNFRQRILPKLIKNKIFKTGAISDTIFMTETFDAICINCSSDWMKVLIKDTVYSVRAEILGHKGGVNYKVEAEPFYPTSKDFQYELRNSELIEIVSKIRNGDTLTFNPLQYGSDNCNDGDHTIFTIIYPGRKIEALYVRCWTPYFYRNRK